MHILAFRERQGLTNKTAHPLSWARRHPWGLPADDKVGGVGHFGQVAGAVVEHLGNHRGPEHQVAGQLAQMQQRHQGLGVGLLGLERV